MDLIEDIGPILGIVAFLGFAILALLIVLQAREVRRLREWAGRAPERAVEADVASLAASEERGDLEKPERPSHLAAIGQSVSGFVAPKWAELDRRSPIDPRLLVAGLVALVVAAVLTSGFGLLSSDPAPTTGVGTSEEKPEKIEVAVLNATQQEGLADPVVGIADLVADDVVKSSEFKAGATGNSLAGVPDSVVMFEPGSEEDADALADQVSGDLGNTGTLPMTDAVRGEAKGASLAILVGFDDRALGEEAAP